MIPNNKYNHTDRNGLTLEYGDHVLLKSWWSNMYLFTVIGFTETQVACLSGSNVFYRKPINVVKVSNAKKWRKN